MMISGVASIEKTGEKMNNSSFSGLIYNRIEELKYTEYVMREKRESQTPFKKTS